MSTLHPSLPTLPERIAALPVDDRGYPVPFFVEWIDGKPDFRVMDQKKMAAAVNQHLCWVCGQPLGVHLAFVIGPMCAINRTSAEPPGHRECSIFSATACPFLSKPQVKRRENDLPEDGHHNPNSIDRNPGVALVWVTKSYKIFRNSDGSPLFEIGPPEEVSFFALGRVATYTEVMHSIDTGMPFLEEAAKKDGGSAQRELVRRYDATRLLVEATCQV